MRRAVPLFFLLFLFAVPPSGAGEPPHPLEGKIYLPGEARFVPEDEILGRMRRADIIYLGERHDNPGHHRLQARLLKALIRSGKRPAAAFEMFTHDVAAKLAAHLARPGADMAMIPEIVGWKERGWPAWKMYAPIVEAAHRAGLPIVAADMARDIARRIGMRGLSALPVAMRARLGLGPPAPRHRALVMADLFISHCQMVPRDKLGGLYDAWRARNRTMALSIREAIRKGAGGAVLITGSGHADRETGVPPHIETLMPGARQFSLAFAEVEKGEESPAGYADRPGAYDALWFTARHEREDPCEEFKASLEKLRKRKMKGHP